MNAIEVLSDIIGKIQGYNNSVNELNELLLHQQIFGDLNSLKVLRKSIDSLVWVKYYGWFEEDTSALKDFNKIIKYEKDSEDRSTDYLKRCFNFNSLKDFFEGEFKENYDKCINSDKINYEGYVELLINIIMIKIDSILDYNLSLDFEDKCIRDEKVRLCGELSLVTRNEHRLLNNISEKDRLQKRKELIDGLTSIINDLDRKKKALDLLVIYTNSDLQSFYEVYKKLCLYQNEIMDIKDGKCKKDNSNQDRINNLITSVEQYKLIDEEFDILSQVMDNNIVEDIRMQMKSYRPIELNIKVKQKKKIL